MKPNYQFTHCPTCKSPMVKGKGAIDHQCPRCDTKIILNGATNPNGDLLPIVINGEVASIYDHNPPPDLFKDNN